VLYLVAKAAWSQLAWPQLAWPQLAWPLAAPFGIAPLAADDVAMRNGQPPPKTLPLAAFPEARRRRSNAFAWRERPPRRPAIPAAFAQAMRQARGFLDGLPALKVSACYTSLTKRRALTI
jgi:hypothetical protein